MNLTSTLTVSHESQSTYASIEPTLVADGHTMPSIRLQCNETPFDLPQALKLELAAKIADLAWNRYPDFYNTELTALLATQVGVRPENVLVGNGSSALIQQIFNCCSSFLSVAVLERPTFTFYHQVCQNEQLPYQEWDLSADGSYDLSTFPQLAEPALVALTSPNNPLGTTLPQAVLRNLLDQYPQCIFIVDEAYGEFCGESAVALTHDYTNLLVLKTLSKGYGLPAIRFGYVVGSVVLMQMLRKYTVPFTVNCFTELIVREALTNPAVAQAVRVNRERVKNLRDFVHYLLTDMATHNSFTIQPSAANFLLLRFQNPELLDQIKQTLHDRAILVSYPMYQCLRLTIGTEVEMNQVVRIIKHAVTQEQFA